MAELSQRGGIPGSYGRRFTSGLRELDQEGAQN
jgi:hypothetical protein